MPKNVNGGPFGLYQLYSVAKYQKTRNGDSFETLKNFRKKVAQCRKKIEREPLVSYGFVGYVKIVKNKRRTLLHKFPLTGLGLMVVVLVVSIAKIANLTFVYWGVVLLEHQIGYIRIAIVLL